MEKLAGPKNVRSPVSAAVMVDGGRHALIRQRQSLDAMIADEVTTPQWISA